MNLAPWLRILDEAGKRHESQLNALINEYEGNRDSENVARVIKVKRIIAEKITIAIHYRHKKRCTAICQDHREMKPL